MLYCDIDGVLRDLCGAANINPTEYNCRIGPENLSFIDYFNEHLELLILASPTEYLSLLYFYSIFMGEVTLISNQPDHWQVLTHLWIDRYFEHAVEVIFTDRKLDFLCTGDWLIEDSPFLSDYSQVVVIDRSYNQDIKLPHLRVKTPAQLAAEILRRSYEISTQKDSSNYGIISK